MIATSRDISRLTRRSFLTGGLVAAAGFAMWMSIRESLPDDGIPRPLRRAEEADDVFSHALFGNTRLARTFDAADIGEARANGDIGLHVLAIMQGVLQAAAEKRLVTIDQPCERPAALGDDEAKGLLA